MFDQELLELSSVSVCGPQLVNREEIDPSLPGVDPSSSPPLPDTSGCQSQRPDRLIQMFAFQKKNKK